MGNTPSAGGPVSGSTQTQTQGQGNGNGGSSGSRRSNLLLNALGVGGGSSSGGGPGSNSGSRRSLRNSTSNGNNNPNALQGSQQKPATPPSPPPALAFIDGGRTASYGLLYNLLASSQTFPENASTAAADYDLHVVKKSILDRRLAPFYNTEMDENLHLQLSQMNNPLMVVGDEHQQELPPQEIEVPKNNPNPIPLESFPFLECPICFLSYPKNINYTRCCDQPICTDCFLQIKRPEQTFEPASCPYCVTPHFGVLYHPVGSVGWKVKWPPSDEELLKEKRKSVPFKRPPTLFEGATLQSLDITEAPLSNRTTSTPESNPEIISSQPPLSSTDHTSSKPMEIPLPSNTSLEEKVEPSSSPPTSSSPASPSSIRRKSLGHKHPSILTSDDIRPEWQQKKLNLEMQRALEQQRQALATARRRQIEAFTSSHMSNAAQFAAQLFEAGSGRASGTTGSRRSRGSGAGIGVDTATTGEGLSAGQYIQAIRYLGADVEELMMLEAMRRSMQDAAAQQQESRPSEDITDLSEEERIAIQNSLDEAQNSNINGISGSSPQETASP